MKTLEENKLNPGLVASAPSSTGESVWSKQKFFTDFKYLLLEQLIQLKAIWLWTLLISLLMPLVFIFSFTRIGAGLSDKMSLIYIITGSATFAVATEGIYTMSQRISSMKSQGQLLYYASLPLSKPAFILAQLGSRLLVVGLPGLILPTLIGPLFYHLELRESLLWLVLLLPLTALSLSAVGMALGLWLEAELVPLVANAFIFLLLAASPVFIPYSSLLLPFQLLSYLLPPTYAADALRCCWSGELGISFYLDVLALLIFSLAGLVGVNKFLKWRVE